MDDVPVATTAGALVLVLEEATRLWEVSHAAIVAQATTEELVETLEAGVASMSSSPRPTAVTTAASLMHASFLAVARAELCIGGAGADAAEDAAHSAIALAEAAAEGLSRDELRAVYVTVTGMFGAEEL